MAAKRKRKWGRRDPKPGTTVYRYRPSRRVWLWSLVYMAFLAGLAVALLRLYEGGYLSAWFTSCLGALLLLMALSIPRRIRLDDRMLRVECLLDLTEVPLDEIAAVRAVPREEMRGIIPLFGGLGFFGYYGHYLDVIQVERVTLYASEWDNFVEITNIYEERLYLSCSERDDLIARLEQAMADRHAVRLAAAVAAETAEAAEAADAAGGAPLSNPKTDSAS